MSTKRKSNEGALEERVSKALKSAGLYNHHNDATVMPGIPDRYVVGGVWVEIKREATFDATRRSLDRQRKWLDMLHQAGDAPWVCCWVGERLYIEPWHVWKLRENGHLKERTPFGSPFFSNSMEDVDDAVATIVPMLKEKRRG